MPSLKSGLRNSLIHEDAGSRRDDSSDFDDTETKLTDYKRRGSSLPASTSSISVRLLPSLQHSLTDPNLWTNKAIPTDVIETDYLSQTHFSSESLHETADNKLTFQKESNSPHRSAADLDSKLHANVCRELQKAYLDWLGQRVITRRGPKSSERSNYSLLLNADLVDRITLDIVRMSEREPSGLRGCRLRTRIDRQHSADMDLGCVRIDQDAEETFEIVLSLRECGRRRESAEKRPLGLVANVSTFLSNVFGAGGHSQQQQQQQQKYGRVQKPIEVLVSDAYQLEKIKLKRFQDGCHHNATSNVGLCSA